MKPWLLALVVLVGCSWFCKDRVRVVEVPIERVKQCVDEPPPDLLPWAAAGPDNGCPAPFEACLSHDANGALAKNLDGLYTWIRAQWAKCGPRPTTQPASQPAHP